MDTIAPTLEPAGVSSSQGGSSEFMTRTMSPASRRGQLAGGATHLPRAELPLLGPPIRMGDEDAPRRRVQRPAESERDRGRRRLARPEQREPIQPLASDQLRGRGAVREGVAEIHPAGEGRHATVNDQKGQESPGAPGPAFVLLETATQPESRREEEPQVPLVTQNAGVFDVAEGENAGGAEAEGRQGHLPGPEQGDGQRQRQQSRQRLQTGPGVEQIGVPEMEIEPRQGHEGAPGHPQHLAGLCRIPTEAPPGREAGAGQRDELDEPRGGAGQRHGEAGRGFAPWQWRELSTVKPAIEQPSAADREGQDVAVDGGLAEQPERRPEGERRPAAERRGAGQPDEEGSGGIVAADHRVLVEREVAEREERALTAAERRPAGENEGRATGQDKVHELHRPRRRRHLPRQEAEQGEEVPLAAPGQRREQIVDGAALLDHQPEPGLVPPELVQKKARHGQEHEGRGNDPCEARTLGI